MSHHTQGKSFFSFLKKPWVIILLVFLAIGISFFAFGRKNTNTTYETDVVKKQTIIQEVSVTGKVKAADTTNLAFESNGRVLQVYRKVGDEVKVGDVIVELDPTELSAEYRQTLAGLEAEEARLAEVKRGARPEEIALAEIKLETTKDTYNNALISVINVIRESFTKSDDAIRNKTDGMFENPRTAPVLSQYIANEGGPQLKIDVEAKRLELEKMLTDWKSSQSTLSVVSSDIKQKIEEARINLQNITVYFDKLALGVNKLKATTDLSETTISTWKSDLSLARSNINTVLSSLNTTEEGFRTAGSAITSAEQELALKQAGSSEEAIAAQEAVVRSAEAKLDLLKVRISKTLLKSPIDGVITKQDAKLGEVVTPNTSLVSVMSHKKLEIEANITESDIAKIEVGQSADVTLDAFGNDEIFKAKVVSIDPAEIIIEGVPTYKTKFELEPKEKEAKPGMTANITVFTQTRENVLGIPNRAISYKSGEKFVRRVLKKDEKEILEEVSVKTGIRNSDGIIEVIEGLQEGDIVAIGASEE